MGEPTICAIATDVGHYIVPNHVHRRVDRYESQIKYTRLGLPDRRSEKSVRMFRALRRYERWVNRYSIAMWKAGLDDYAFRSPHELRWMIARARMRGHPHFT